MPSADKLSKDIMRKAIKLFCLLSLILFLTGCRSQKIGVKDQSTVTPEKTRFESVVQNSFSFEALQSKTKYTLGSTSLNGKMCLESGKRLCLQVNAPLLGFEIARVEATQEQILLVDKYDKVYCAFQLSDIYQIEEISGHELEALECLMLGRIYIPGKGVAKRRDYKSLTWTTPKLADGTYGVSEALYQGNDYSLLYRIDASGRLVSTRLTVGNKSALWEYAEYREVQKNKFVPVRETITAMDAGNEKFTAGLSLNSPELGESTWRNFEPNNSYREVSLQEMLEIVKQLGK